MDYLDELLYDCKNLKNYEIPAFIGRVLSLSDLDEDTIIQYLKMDEAEYEEHIYYSKPIPALEALRIKKRLATLLKKSIQD